jgi:4-hydroxy 2-oxovalerate aldolase
MPSEKEHDKILEPVTKLAQDVNREITILDTTLRDGSYAIDFKFSIDDTKRIARELESAGIYQIEIGHGWGLNAASAGLGIAAQTDAEYIKAARSVIKKSIFGCFFIPGVARAGDMIMARELGMDFIRIGNNITEYTKQEDYIKIAKNLGFQVSSNLLKSYIVSPEEFATSAKHVGEMGADVAVLVDSAGGMTPREVKQYIRAARRKTSVKLGFHGHDNLGLANANALTAVEEGATVIDSTLQGIGRSAGNAKTESLVIILEESGYTTNVDKFKLMDTGERLIRPYLISCGGIDPVDFVLGQARFHSSFVPVIKEIASEIGIDFRKLIVEVAKVDRTKPSKELIREVAARLKQDVTPEFVLQSCQKEVAKEKFA